VCRQARRLTLLGSSLRLAREHAGAMTALPSSISSEDADLIGRAARYLHSQGAVRVWLFGSLAKGKRPTVHSDFDFAVEGLPRDRYLNCLGSLLQWAPRPVDLVEVETCPALLRERILAEGILLTGDENRTE
jgi:predicted nucleotidyltransferase